MANVQHDFLIKLCTDKTVVAVYLVNGIRLTGVITGLDDYVVLLSHNGVEQMVYKHAIGTVVPAAK